jgi:hypothetical protein
MQTSDRSTPRPDTRWLLLLLLIVLLALGALAGPTNAIADGASVVASPRLPFLTNVGRLPAEVAFHAPTFGGACFVTHDGALVHSLPLGSHDAAQDDVPSVRPRTLVLREAVVGAAPVTPRGVGRSATRVTYLHAATGSDGRVAPAYDAVRLDGILPGVSLELVARRQGVERIFHLDAGTRADDLHVRIEGADGLHVLADGLLEARTSAGSARFSRPVAWQETDAGRREVAVAYVVEGTTYGFAVGLHDEGLPLHIDPLLGSTYLGAEGNDWVRDVAVSDTSIFVVGQSQATAFPTTPGVFQEAIDPSLNDVVISRFDAGLTTLEASTFLGGSGDDGGWSLALSGSSIYVTGRTSSAGFPTTPGAYDQVHAGGAGLYDAFVARLSDDLTTLQACTFLGGLGGDFAHGIDLLAGDVVLAGHTSSPLFPTTSGAYDETYNGSNDGFVARFDGDLTTLEAATYLGGSGSDLDLALTVAGGDVYLAGTTKSADFPTSPGGYDTTLAGDRDVFVARLTGGLSTLLGATYLGGTQPATSDEEGAGAVAVADGQVYVTGYTLSPGFPTTPLAFDTALTGDDYADAFVSRFSDDLTTLQASTFLGGDGDDLGHDLCLSATDVFVVGESESSDFPTTAGAFDENPNGDEDAFVARLGRDLVALDGATLLGSLGQDRAVAAALDTDSIVFAGTTWREGFPTTPGAYDDDFIGFGSADIVVSRLSDDLSEGVVGGPTSSFLVPRKLIVKPHAKLPAKGKLLASGFFDSGPDAADLSLPATLSLDDLDAVFGSPVAAKGGWLFSAGGTELLLKTRKLGSSRGTFRFKAVGADPGGMGPDGPLAVRFDNGTLEPECNLDLAGGRFKLGKPPGNVTAPALHLQKARAALRGSGKDTLALVLGMAGPGAPPPVAPQVELGFGAAFSEVIPSAAFTQRGSTWRYKGSKGALTSVVLDYGRDLVRVKGAGLDLGALPPGAQPIEIGLVLDADDQRLAVRMVKKGSALRY